MSLWIAKHDFRVFQKELRVFWPRNSLSNNLETCLRVPLSGRDDSHAHWTLGSSFFLGASTRCNPSLLPGDTGSSAQSPLWSLRSPPAPCFYPLHHSYLDCASGSERGPYKMSAADHFLPQCQSPPQGSRRRNQLKRIENQSRHFLFLQCRVRGWGLIGKSIKMRVVDGQSGRGSWGARAAQCLGLLEKRAVMRAIDGTLVSTQNMALWWGTRLTSACQKGRGEVRGGEEKKGNVPFRLTGDQNYIRAGKTFLPLSFHLFYKMIAMWAGNIPSSPLNHIQILWSLDKNIPIYSVFFWYGNR